MSEELTALKNHIPNILNILLWPDKRLQLKSEPVEVFDENLQTFVKDMFATMAALGGVALAAPQVDRQEQIIVMMIEEEKPLVFINPEITPFSKETFEWEEGCLSVPGYFKKRKRPKVIGVKFKDMKGEEHVVQFGGLYAFAIQHEVDHLNGKCFVDDISMVWRPKIKKKIRAALPELEKKASMARIQLEHQGKKL